MTALGDDATVPKILLLSDTLTSGWEGGYETIKYHVHIRYTHATSCRAQSAPVLWQKDPRLVTPASNQLTARPVHLSMHFLR